MPLTPREKAALEALFKNQANATIEVGVLKDNGLGFGSGKLVPQKYKNYAELKWWLKATFLIHTDLAGIREVAEIIERAAVKPNNWKIEVLEPPPINVGKEVTDIKHDCAYAAVIDTIYVQLDVDQNKHQPKEAPIGTRQIHGEKFGTYATTDWHQRHTMQYMADWAKGLAMEEGQKIEHGQSKRVEITTAGTCSFEGYAKLLGGTKYVSFHCYPNSH